MQSSSKTKLCKFYINGHCNKEDKCTFIHGNNTNTIISTSSKIKTKNRHNNLKNKKNTECFEPMTRPVDLRILYDLDQHSLQQSLTDRDLLCKKNVMRKIHSIYSSLDDLIK